MNKGLFVLFQGGEECLCGDGFNAETAQDVCDWPCNGDDTLVCGGSGGSFGFLMNVIECTNCEDVVQLFMGN